MSNILEQLIQELKGTQDAGVGLRHAIGDPTTSPDPAYLFAPHGEDSVRVYWNEGTQPLAAWLPLEPNDAVEDTVEFLSYLVPSVTQALPGVPDGQSRQQPFLRRLRDALEGHGVRGGFGRVKNGPGLDSRDDPGQPPGRPV